MDDETMAIYILWLNDMRASKVEHLEPVCWAETREGIDDLLTREKVEQYSDPMAGGGFWGKGYRKGGPLEWFNPPFDHRHIREFSDPREVLPHVAVIV